MTVTHTLTTFYIYSSSVTAGSATKLASACKKEICAALVLSHTFIPIAIETMGPIGLKASSFFPEFGFRLSATTSAVTHESAFLFQQLSTA